MILSESRSNLVLLGLPGSGKSTIGARLAQYFDRPFLDTDRLIEGFTGRSLQQIVDTDGALQLRAIEAQIVAGLMVFDTVIATGGSVIYSDVTMRHLQSLGLLVYLRAREETILERIGDYSQRGIARLPGQSIASVIEERLPLYERYANVVVDVDGLTEPQVMAACVAVVESQGPR
ncbi:MAG: shikimate kinase [Rhodocyclaceae bacterium]|jgi:shikimate kinase|nr:shikimate kinase [Rhodocyclaceae bacterium]